MQYLGTVIFCPFVSKDGAAVQQEGIHQIQSFNLKFRSL